MRKLLLTVAATVAAGLAVVAPGAAADVPPPSFWGIAPIVVPGAPDCNDLTGWLDPTRTFSTQIKFVLPVNGTNGGGMTITIDAASTGGDRLGWYVLRNEDVRAVIVKGGPSANVYYYPVHATGTFVDGSLTTPGKLDKKGIWKFPTLSYMEFCYFPSGA